MNQTQDDSELCVRELMTENPVVVEPDVSLERVMALMREASIRHLPVVDEEGLIGVVSDRDLKFVHGIPGVVDKVEDDDIEALLKAPVAVVMKSRFLIERDVVCVGRDEPIGRAVDALLANRVGALPVVDDQKSVVGILSAVDVLRWVNDEVL